MTRDELMDLLLGPLNTPGECDFVLVLVGAWMAEHPKDYDVFLTAEGVGMLRSCWDAEGNPIPDYPMGDPRHSDPE